MKKQVNKSSKEAQYRIYCDGLDSIFRNCNAKVVMDCFIFDLILYAKSDKNIKRANNYFGIHTGGIPEGRSVMFKISYVACRHGFIKDIERFEGADSIIAQLSEDLIELQTSNKTT